jgi:N-acetylglucosamine kinase-like BadF-type ATPase
MTERFFVGIDGGGSKTSVVCVNEAGSVVGQGSAGPTNLTSTSVGAASLNLREGVRQALENLPQDKTIVKLVMGLAGMDSESEHDVAIEVFAKIIAPFGIQNFELVNDSVIALENGSNNPNAFVLISGTGSNCHGRNAQGKTAKAGGMDYLLADQGSGYAIGRQVLLAAVKSFDGRGKKTILEQLVCQHFGLTDCSSMKAAVYQPPLNKLEIGQFTTLCRQAVDQGDEVALAIFDEAVEELLAHIASVLHQLELESIPTEGVLSGSVLDIPYIREKLIWLSGERWPQVTLSTPTQPPVWGAIKLALRT